ncbi:hypothetical protein AAHA92_05804 [Salvia divinorum]|uniref:Zinc finger GRF-type domain-containing protein n=1 Tax=Salvia divinorum TaxID=28513 RepID=A0ABD1I4H8_SALDI
MELRCAGKSAMNAGRYYYKCPANAKHPGSFMWSDEYHVKSAFRVSTPEHGKGNQTHVVRHAVHNRESNWPTGCNCCCGTKARTAITTQVMICFMGACCSSLVF